MTVQCSKQILRDYAVCACCLLYGFGFVATLVLVCICGCKATYTQFDLHCTLLTLLPMGHAFVSIESDLCPNGL